MRFLSNYLKNETSPYLLQHAENPVQWYPWGKEAFEKAKEQDKPIFLSIGYSSCHWCHVMAHESFEDEGIAALLNRHFISIKVDREERPDVDSIYMSVCQAFTGSGGWPTSIFMTPEQKPFFAGTYFPKDTRGSMIGMRELLTVVQENWQNNREELLDQAEKIVLHLNKNEATSGNANTQILDTAVSYYKRIFDRKNAGFGRAPKFPTPHNILFLLGFYERYNDTSCLEMAEKTLMQMYRGGLFDHIGFGFCRYSTDERFLVPHFEKMLYDNALLIMAYCKAHTITKKPLYLEIAEKTADYIMREMTSQEGGFYSAQDADSEGEEGKYYLFEPQEIIDVLGKNGDLFNKHFGISQTGNFEGKNIPNLLGSDPNEKGFEQFLPALAEMRKKRYALHLDDKILTLWNGLMIAAMCNLYLVSRNKKYLFAAQNADKFIKNNLCEGDTLFVSFREGKRGVKGFLDDYAACIFAQLALHRATLEQEYLDRAKAFCKTALAQFEDEAVGGFYLYSDESENLILRPKETYDGAIPSGNSLMAYNLVRLSILEPRDIFEGKVQGQLDFLASQAESYPLGHAMYLLALLEHYDPPIKVTVVLDKQSDAENLSFKFAPDANITVLYSPTKEYPLKNSKTTFYVCKNNNCLPPVNDLSEVL